MLNSFFGKKKTSVRAIIFYKKKLEFKLDKFYGRMEEIIVEDKFRKET